MVKNRKAMVKTRGISRKLFLGAAGERSTMKPHSLVALATAVLASVLLVGPRGAAAGDTRCNGVLPPGPHDNVVVPRSADCEIVGATIRGNLTLQPGSGTIDVRQSEIRGNVQGERFAGFLMFQSIVGGNVQMKSFSELVFFEESTIGQNLVVEGGAGLCRGIRTRVGGNLQVYKNLGDLQVLEVSGNDVRQNLQVYENNVGEGGMFVEANRVENNLQVYKNVGPGFKGVLVNTVSQTLQCFENEEPFFGVGNVAEQSQGQCEAEPTE